MQENKGKGESHRASKGKMNRKSASKDEDLTNRTDITDRETGLAVPISPYTADKNMNTVLLKGPNLSVCLHAQTLR